MTGGRRLTYDGVFAENRSGHFDLSCVGSSANLEPVRVLRDVRHDERNPGTTGVVEGNFVCNATANLSAIPIFIG